MKKHFRINQKLLVVVIIFLMLISILSACTPIDKPSSSTPHQNKIDETTTKKPDVNTTIPDDIVKQPLSITCLAGTPGCYKLEGNTLTFTSVSADSIYAISGTLEGNIIIDTGNNYKFELEMHGFTLICDYTSPITVLSGDEIDLKAKKGYDNFIYDNRQAVNSTDVTQKAAAIYSEVDLELSGKGNLVVNSKNNNGIYTKDDLQVKNLTLNVICKDNALRGNDGVEIINADTTLIASAGDCIKTSNSHINATTGNQKGKVYIAGGNHFLYAACDGIDSSYDVLIENSAEYTTNVSIFTGKYSEYSENISTSSSKGIKSANEIVIKSGSVNIQSYEEGISAENDGGVLENGNVPKGNVTISGGTVNIKSNNKGIYADGSLNITSNTVNIDEFCE